MRIGRDLLHFSVCVTCVCVCVCVCVGALPNEFLKVSTAGIPDYGSLGIAKEVRLCIYKPNL